MHFFPLSAEMEVEKIESEIAAAAAEEDAKDEDLVCPKTLENEEAEGEEASNLSKSTSNLSISNLVSQPLDAPLIPDSCKSRVVSINALHSLLLRNKAKQTWKNHLIV